MTGRPGGPPWVHALFGAWCALMLASLVWPGYAWIAGRYEPYVLGLPFCFAWTAGCALASCVVLVIYQKVTGG